MTPQDAICFVQKHGIVLASGKGPVPNLAEEIAGGPIKGSWWSHPSGRAIFRIFSDIDDRSDILVCRLVEGKITFVHRRLWPALVRAAAKFDSDRLARVHQRHTETGQHVNQTTKFPNWVPSEIAQEAEVLNETEAFEEIVRLLGQRP